MTNPENNHNLPTPENPENGFSIEIRNPDKLYDLLKFKQFQQGCDPLDSGDHCFDEICGQRIDDNLITNLDFSIIGLNNESKKPYQEYNLCLYINRQCYVGNIHSYDSELDDDKRILTSTKIKEISEKMFQMGIPSNYHVTEDGSQYLKISLNGKIFTFSLGFGNDVDMAKYYHEDWTPEKYKDIKGKYQYLYFFLINEENNSLKPYEKNYTILTTKDDFQTTLNDFVKISEVFIKSYYFSFNEPEPNLKLIIDYPTSGDIPYCGYCQATGTIRRYNIPKSKENIEELSQLRQKPYDSKEINPFIKPKGKIEANGKSPKEIINFDSIAGQSRAVAEAKKLVLAINHPEVYEKRGVKTPKGILFYGPPGTGKTLIAKAISTEIDAELFEISFSDIGSKWYGESEQRIQEVFDNANKVTKTGRKVIILFDELDSMAPSRNDAYEGSKKIVSIILQNLDGFRSNKDVLIVGTTNRPEDIDPALKRPGRIDKIIAVDLPELEDRKAILQLHINKAIERSTESHDLFSSDLDIQKIAESTRGMSGADLANIINLTLESKTVLELEGLRWTPVSDADIEKTLIDFNLKKEEKKRIGFN